MNSAASQSNSAKILFLLVLTNIVVSEKFLRKSSFVESVTPDRRNLDLWFKSCLPPQRVGADRTGCVVWPAPSEVGWQRLRPTEPAGRTNRFRPAGLRFCQWRKVSEVM